MTAGIRRCCAVLLGLFWLAGAAAATEQPLRLIPYPNRIEPRTGTYRLPAEVAVYTDLKDAGLLERLAASPLGPHRMVRSPKKADIRFVLDDRAGSVPESYGLVVSGEGIRIEAADGAGLFYGLQTLLQLVDQYGRDAIPQLEIEDAPYLRHRGLMIDVSRHFFPVEFIKKQLDLMACYKLNRFHWHLVDGTGWRIEIKRYPELTARGAWRTRESLIEWEDSGLGYATAEIPDAYGGYYTQEEIREVVEYAARRHITVIPEIEMPGHNEEVAAVFPTLACPGQVRANDVCIGNPETIFFFENVLDEVLALFPSEYIHIGGDEAAKNGWERCEKCRALMKREGYASLDELQSHLIRHFERFLNARGRKLIGWDEIMQGGLSPNATVMSWRGPQYGAQAAAMGHDAVMSPIQYCYFNFYQDAPCAHVLSWAGYTPLEKVYGYDPVPKTVSPEERKHVLGIQANLWTEYIPTCEQAETMLWPRALAIAETGWSRPERKSYGRFRENAGKAVERMHAMGYRAFDLASEAGERPASAERLHHLASGCPVVYRQPFTEDYPAAREAALTDGVQGGWSYEDNRWQGFIGNDMDVVIDLGRQTRIRRITANFIQDRFGWFWLPGEVEISVSEDGERFETLEILCNRIPFTQPGFFLEPFGWQGDAQGRYVRYTARIDRTNPKSGYIFTDEVVVR